MRGFVTHRAIPKLLCLWALMCAGAATGVAQAQLSPAELEKQVAWLVNYERMAAQLGPLSLDAKLSGVARTHSQEMLDRGYVGHDSPVPGRKTPRERYLAAYDVPPAFLGENVARVPASGLPETMPQKVHQALIGGPEGKAHMLRPEATQLGLGCVVSEDGTVYATALYAAPGESPGVTSAAGVPAAKGTASSSASSPATSGGSTLAPPVASSPVSRPVQVRIWRGEIGPGRPLTVRVRVRVATGLRFSARAQEPSTNLRVDCRRPRDRATITWLGEGCVGNGPGEPVLADGDYILEVTADRQTHCRLLVVTGSLTDVQRYGLVLRAPTVLQPGEPQRGSLGDGGGTDNFRLVLRPGQTATVRVAALEGNLRASLAVFDSSGSAVARAKWASETREGTLSLISLPPGEYILVLTDPNAVPGTGDYELRLEPGTP